MLSPDPLRLIRLAAWLVRLHTDHADLKRKRPGSSQHAPMNRRTAMRTGLMAHHRQSALPVVNPAVFRPLGKWAIKQAY